MITQEGKVIGTPAYMSPEQAVGKDVGPQSDIFSLGVVAYEVLGQQKPFEGKSYSEVLEKIQTFEPLSVANINPLIQPDFENIVSKMLEKDLGKRYQTIRDVIVDIETAMEKFRMTRDRRQLVSYVTDPDAYEAAFKEKTINRCLSQGAFYMNKGQNHFDEAIVEFQRILHLDPDNARARKNLERVMAERGKDNTVTVEVTASSAGRDEGAGQRRVKKRHKSVTVVAASGRNHKSGRGGKIAFSLLVAAAVVVAGWFAYQGGYLPTGFFERQGNRAPVLSAPKHMTVTSGERIAFTLQAVDAEGDSVSFYSDGLPRGAELSDAGEFSWKVDFDQTGTHKIKFYAEDGTSASVSESTIEVQATELALDFKKIGSVKINAGSEFSRTLRATSSSGKRVRFTLEEAPDGMEIAKDKLTWSPGPEVSGKYQAVIRASDGYVSEMQAVTLNVQSNAKREAELARVDWKLPEQVNVFVDGDLKETETRRFNAGLSKGKHTLRAELMDGTTGWMEELNLEPGEKVALQAPVLSYGKLSVYFLGGVGEFRVNGKLFKAQPPFSGVSVVVGTHRVSCRMANESTVKEFTISVEEDRETVIEYEIGSEPVVTIER
jgi:hypothetical protein